MRKPEVERNEHQDDAHVHCQPLPEVVTEEQNVHGDHDHHQERREDRANSPTSHSPFLLLAAENPEGRNDKGAQPR